jgi:hypothetical protein
VLQHDEAHHEVETAVVERQVPGDVVDELDAVRERVERARPVDHAGGDVDADDVLNVLGKPAAEPPDAAAEVQRPAAEGAPGAFDDGAQPGGVPAAGCEELGLVPAAVPALVGGEHGPQRVGRAEGVPRRGVLGQGHLVLPT